MSATPGAATAQLAPAEHGVYAVPGIRIERAASEVHVAAGVLIDRRGRVLIAQRPPGKHLAGAWEFPGGKLEAGEQPIEGLRRELREELGIEIGQPRPLLRLHHIYPHGQVLLDVWVVRRYSGEPVGLDGQALRWCARARLAEADLLPADRPIVDALWLPQTLRRCEGTCYELVEIDAIRAADRQARMGGAGALVGADERRRRGARLRGTWCRDRRDAGAAIASGAAFLALREQLASDEVAALCAAVDVPVFARGLTLGEAWELGSSGVNAIL